MNTVLHVGQWVVSIIGLVAFCYPLFAALKENRTLGIVGLFFPPVSVPVFLVVYWKKYPMLQALIVFVVMGAAAAGLQRLRLGFWDWPDVDYQVEPAENR